MNLDAPFRFVVGLDLSLTATGVADYHGSLHTIESEGTIRDTLAQRRARLDSLADLIIEHVSSYPELVVIEAPSLGQGRQRGTVDRAGLWWLVVDRLASRRVPVLEVPPANVKTFATGKGNAKKPDIRMEVFKRYGQDIADDNQADAFVLRAIGLHLLGAPLVKLPQTHTRALDALVLPAGAERPVAAS